MMKFDRQAAIAGWAGTTGSINLTVSGQLNDGRRFTGVDRVVGLWRGHQLHIPA
ncbi:MAG: hypothetical protein AAB270_02955 [Chloroflexota bacterium]